MTCILLSGSLLRNKWKMAYEYLDSKIYHQRDSLVLDGNFDGIDIVLIRKKVNSNYDVEIGFRGISSPYDEYKGILLYENISTARWKELKEKTKNISKNSLKKWIKDLAYELGWDEFNLGDDDLSHSWQVMMASSDFFK